MTDFVNVFEFVCGDLKNHNNGTFFCFPNIVENDTHNYNDVSVFDDIIMFDCEVFLEKNLKSYHYDPNNIWRQFIQDCPRSIITFNGELVNIENYEHKFNKKIMMNRCKINVNDISYELYDILGMICNQSSFAFPYFYLSNLFNTKYCKILSSASNRYIDIQKSEHLMDIVISTTFELRNIRTNTVKYIFNLKMLISFVPEKGIYNKYGVMSWCN